MSRTHISVILDPLSQAKQVMLSAAQRVDDDRKRFPDPIIEEEEHLLEY